MAKNKITLPKNFNYYDKYLKREVKFTSKEDEMVVTLAPRLEIEGFETMESAVLIASNRGDALGGLSKANLSRGIAVIKVAPQAEVSMAMEAAEDNDEFLNQIPAFLDEDGLNRYFIPDEITVQFNPDVNEQRAEEIIIEQGSSIVVKQRTPGYYTIAVPEGNDVFSTINTFNDLQTVRFAEASEIGFDDAQLDPPDDTRFGELWGLKNTGQNGGTPGADISVLDAWDTTRGDENVIVVVIDTGMDMHHVDLTINLVPRNGEDWDFAATDGDPQDSGEHGTHVCGTIAAVGNNNQGISGVAPNCRLMPLRVNLQAGMNANRADAINFAGAKAAANPDKRYIINCSWRASGSFSAILAAIDNAVHRGALVVFAAGNAGRDMDIQPPQYPGVHSTAICVAALDSTDKRANFSNVGSQVDVSAPGVDILSTVPGNNYNSKNGTSMASPHVAGVAALIWSANLALLNLDVRKILEDSCDDVSASNPGLNGKLGRGRVNAARAVDMANV